MSNKLTDAEKRKAYSAAVALASRLTQAFEGPAVPPRNRFILTLRGLTDFMREIGCPIEWREKVFEMGQALGDLEFGVTPELLRPARHIGEGRPNDEMRIWRARSRAVLACQARERRGMSLSDRVRDIKKHHPKLARASYVTGREAKLQTSLENWERKLNKIKQGNHLDLVADDYWDLKRDLETRSAEMRRT